MTRTLAPQRFTRRLVVDGGPLGRQEVAATFVVPPPATWPTTPVVLICLPGGAMSKRYFDLSPGDDRSFSFAEAMAAHGLITVAIDHPGVGDSSGPDDPYSLDPDAVAATDHAAVQAALATLRAGIDAGTPIDRCRVIGVGHSMGGMLTGLIQGRYARYDAVALLGAGPDGFRAQLPAGLQPLADDPVTARREIVPRLRAMAFPPLQRLERRGGGGSVFRGGDRRGVDALREAATELIAACGLFSMIPGAWAPEAAAIRVPLLLVFGDDDICPDPRGVPALFPGTGDITLLVLPATGHSHFVFPSRARLFERFASWALSR